MSPVRRSALFSPPNFPGRAHGPCPTRILRVPRRVNRVVRPYKPFRRGRRPRRPAFTSCRVIRRAGCSHPAARACAALSCKKPVIARAQRARGNPSLFNFSPLSVPQIFTTTYWTAFFLTAFSPKVAEYPMNTGIFI